MCDAPIKMRFFAVLALALSWATGVMAQVPQEHAGRIGIWAAPGKLGDTGNATAPGDLTVDGNLLIHGTINGTFPGCVTAATTKANELLRGNCTFDNSVVGTSGSAPLVPGGWEFRVSNTSLSPRDIQTLGNVLYKTNDVFVVTGDLPANTQGMEWLGGTDWVGSHGLGAIDAYMVNHAASAGGGGGPGHGNVVGPNGVAYHAMITCVVTDSACWGINTTSVMSNHPGELAVGAEFDAVVYHPDTKVRGIISHVLADPSIALSTDSWAVTVDAQYQINPNGVWGIGYRTGTNCCRWGYVSGPAHDTPNSASQPFEYQHITSDGANHFVGMQALAVNDPTLMVSSDVGHAEVMVPGGGFVVGSNPTPIDYYAFVAAQGVAQVGLQLDPVGFGGSQGSMPVHLAYTDGAAQYNGIYLWAQDVGGAVLRVAGDGGPAEIAATGGFTVGTASPSGYFGLLVQDGTANTGIQLGTVGTAGPNRPSLPVRLTYADATSAEQIIELQAATGPFAPILHFISSIPTVEAFISAAGYMVGPTYGANCSTLPTASFHVTNGIVTTC